MDHIALEVMRGEMQASLCGQAALAPPVPYRNYVAQTRLGVSEQEHEAFFREQLADIDEPTCHSAAGSAGRRTRHRRSAAGAAG
jgi:arthrofactin-type cyclic lipopeptide synthetase A